jgi:hypothetical protein
MSVNVGPSPIVRDGLVLFLDPSSSLNYTLSGVEVLVVAGGGGGGANHAGGGGAGGLIYRNSYLVTPGTPISVTVGNGGATAPSSTGPAASNGQNSVFDTLVAIGGGGGGNRNDAAGTSPGRDGGSGGGGGGAQLQFAGNYVAGNGTSGQGFPGGRAVNLYGGGGGGAGGKGFDGIGATLLKSGNGGPGLLYSISGSPRYYAGGGGAGYGGNVGNGKGGVGGGGNGGVPAGDPGTPGQANTGGGGGGGGAGGQPGSSGGSGVVIVRYPGPQKATGGTITQVGGFTIHTFNSSATFTPLSFPSNGGTVYGLQNLDVNVENTLVAFNSPTYVTYSSANNGSILFTRTTPPTPEDGGYLTTTTTGNLTALTYLHNDHTTEVWFRSNDRNPTNYDGTEGVSALVVYTGFHSMFYYNATSFTYSIWGRDGSNQNSVYTLSFLNSSVGTWNQIVARRSGNELKLYLNGALQNTGTITVLGTGTPTSNTLRLATANYNGSFSWHANVNIASLRMYNKALTDNEILQNFNATRGRFGI